VLAASVASVGCDGGDTVGPGELQLAPNATVVEVVAGASADLGVAIARGGGFDGAVTIGVEGLPEGVTVESVVIPGSETTGTLPFVADAPVTVDSAAVTLTATPDGLGGQIASSVQLVVEQPQDFSLLIEPDTAHLQPDVLDTTDIVITRTGSFSAPVAFTVEGMPDGMAALFAESTVPGDTARLELTADATVQTDTAFVLTITGTATGVATKTDSLPVLVQAAGSGTSGGTR
jgi:hypothetical protein